MLGMDVGDAALAGYLTLLSGALGALLWTRLNRIEAELATRAGKEELEAVRQELAGKSDKADIEAIRQELAGKADKADVEAIRREMAIMRSDLTQVALAVGARRSQASEG
jgi:hypothetical protein